MSWVFLTADIAYKVKKPIHFPFADFSSLERRRHFCEEEIRINGQFSEGIYLGVVPIGGTPSVPVFEHTPAFEYAVKMRRFETQARMDKQLEIGQLSVDDLKRLAVRICNYQSDLLRATETKQYGGTTSIRRHALDNLDELEPFVTGGARFRRYRRWTTHQLAELDCAFAKRRKNGFIRAGHGDLHLENIVRVGGVLQPFDALEFNPALRCIDTLDEVAMTTMDLMARGEPASGFEFLSAYLEKCGDYAGVPMLRFYMVYRALVRAKVLSLFAEQSGRKARTADNRYLRVTDELIGEQRPMLIIAHGLSGSGKSTVLGGLIGKLHAIRLRSDVERRRLHELPDGAQSNSAIGAGLYDDRSSDETYEELASYSGTLLRNGFSVLVDAAFLHHKRRERFRQLAARYAARMVIVFCVGSEEVLRARIARRTQEGSDASEANSKVLNWQLAQHEPLTIDEQAGAVTVDADAPQDLDQIATAIQQLCRR